MKKKNILSLALAAVLGFSSCDMDQEPYTSYPVDKYMVNLTQFMDASQGIYSAVRSITTGGTVLAPEFQTELFLPTLFFSNAYGDMSSWNMEETNGTAEGVWGNYYGLISRANFILDSYQLAVEGKKGEFSQQELAVLKIIAGESYFARAYAYFNLALFFCDNYDASKADQQLGLPLQLKYDPSHFADKYPGRSSLADTYKQVLEDIKHAYECVSPQDDPSRFTITQDVVKALDARVALHMKNYDHAIQASTSLLSKYPLAATPNDLAVMWVYDEGSEFIWKLYQNFPYELGGSLGQPFWGQKQNDVRRIRMDFYPSTALLRLYNGNDYRTVIYFMDFPLDHLGAPGAKVKVFNKYPGNRSFQEAGALSSDNWYTNISKPFGIAEQYLIAAEAYAERNKADDLAKGAQLLNTFRASRHQKYQVESYNSQNALRQQVRDERTRELVGEGFHFFDLKRWKLGFDRTNTTQVSGFEAQLPYFNALKIEAGDYRFVWPIPKAEIDANPQIKDQQNPGY